MRSKKLLISALVLVGIIITVAAFYLYESAHQVKPSDVETLNILSPTPQNLSGFLLLDSPNDQAVFTNRIIEVSGRAAPGAKIVVLTQTSEVAAIAANDGTFSTNITIDKGQNILEVDSVASDGETAKVKRVVTYSTESF
jgi:hypothetical protein